MMSKMNMKNNRNNNNNVNNSQKKRKKKLSIEQQDHLVARVEAEQKN